MLDLSHEAEKFVASVYQTLIATCPLRTEEDVEFDLLSGQDGTLYVAEFVVPLVHGSGQSEINPAELKYSDLFQIAIKYELTSDSSQEHLAVKSSSFELRVHTAPGIRFEYERGYKSAPQAHIHYSGVAGLVSPALMKNFSDAKDKDRKTEN